MCCLLVLLVTPIPNSSVSGQGQRRTEEICRFLLGITNICDLLQVVTNVTNDHLLVGIIMFLKDPKDSSGCRPSRRSHRHPSDRRKDVHRRRRHRRRGGSVQRRALHRKSRCNPVGSQSAAGGGGGVAISPPPPPLPPPPPPP